MELFTLGFHYAQWKKNISCLNHSSTPSAPSEMLHTFSTFRNHLSRKHCFSRLTRGWLKRDEGSEQTPSDFPDRDSKHVHLPPVMFTYFVQTSRCLHKDYESSQNVNAVLARKHTENPAWVSCGCTVPPRPKFIHCDEPFMASAAKYSPGDSALCSCFSSLSWYWSKWDHNADFPWKLNM